MKKQISSIVLVLVMCLSFCIPTFAVVDNGSDDVKVIGDYKATVGQNNTLILEERTRMVDMAELLSDSERESMLSNLDEISERQKLDVVVVTVDTIDGKTPQDYADDFYDYNGYGFGTSKDGILLLVSMEDRDWHISTTGFGITAFTDAGIDYISNQFLMDLSDGEYYDSFEEFATQCDDFITQAKTGRPYDIGNLPDNVKVTDDYKATVGQNNTLILEERTRMVDMAELLSVGERTSMLSQLNRMSEKQKFDVVIVTVNTIDGKTPQEYADDFYDYNGYGFGTSKDGILLLVSMEDRDWHISTTGFGITAFTDAGIDYISDQFLSDLSDGEYYDAFEEFATQCDDFITQAKTGEPYDTGNLPKESFPFIVVIPFGLIIGLVAALIVTSVMKAKLKSVRMQPTASDYLKRDSMRITNRQDVLLYSHVDRSRKPEPSSSGGGGSSTHISSSGTSHGGGGGKF